MRIRPMLHTFATLMIVLVLSMPFFAIAQQNIIEEAKAGAIADANSSANRATWFMTGCFLNIFGVNIAKKNKAYLPIEKLIGKSPAYVAAYTSSYQAKQAEIQTSWAKVGMTCGTLAIIGCLIYSSILEDNGGGGSPTRSGNAELGLGYGLFTF